VRSFGNERALGQHINSKAHAPVINHDEDILPIARSPPAAFETPFKPLVPGLIDFDDKPEKVEFPRKDNSTSKLYILTPLPGKGQGLIAVQDISKGTRIISEKPLFRIPRSGIGIEQPALEKAIDRKLNLLSQDGQRAFLSLYNNAPGDSYPLSGIVKTNALPLGTSASEGGLFPEASRINHACVPNCQHTWNDNIGEETIHAVRRISKGEEITISYANTGTFESRRRHLKKSFAFDCSCKLCSLPEAARAVSDNRQCEITRLDELIGDGSRLFSNPDRCLEDVHTLLKLLEVENITDARVPRAYYDALQIAIAHGDQARAKVFAQRAYEARLCCEGGDSPLTTRMKSLVARPTEHRLFGTSSRWRLSKKMIPKTLEGERLEAWLRLGNDTKFSLSIAIRYQNRKVSKLSI
jgi:SET domain